MTKNFIITSCIREPHFEFKSELLFNLVKNIKTLIPDSFIIVTEANKLEERCQPYIDIAILDRYSPDDHILINGEVANLHMGMAMLNGLRKEWFYKISYDFIIDETNYQIFENWRQKTIEDNKLEFVGSQWCNMAPEKKPAIGAWAWYCKVNFAARMLPVSRLRSLIEYEMYNNLRAQGLLDRCFFYDYADQMFNGTWDRCCDIINGGGKVIRDDKAHERFKI